MEVNYGCSTVDRGHDSLNGVMRKAICTVLIPIVKNTYFYKFKGFLVKNQYFD